VCVAGDLGAGRADEVLPPQGAGRVAYPAGWRDAVARPASAEKDTGAQAFTP